MRGSHTQTPALWGFGKMKSLVAWIRVQDGLSTHTGALSAASGGISHPGLPLGPSSAKDVGVSCLVNQAPHLGLLWKSTLGLLGTNAVLSASSCHSDVVSEGRLLLVAQPKLITGKRSSNTKTQTAPYFSSPNQTLHWSHSILSAAHDLEVKIPSEGKQNSAGNICLQVCVCGLSLPWVPT